MKDSNSWGFCEMENHDDAVRALSELNGKKIDGNIVYCTSVRTMEKSE